MMETNNQDILVHQILHSGGAYDDLLHRPLLSATRRIAECLPVTASLRQQILDDVFELWQEPPFNQMREIINQIFAKSTSSDFTEEVAARLMKIVRERNWQGHEIAPILAKLGKREEAISVLSTFVDKEIEDEGDADDKIVAAQLLLDLGEQQAATTLLLKIMRSSFGSFAQNAATHALGQMNECNPQVIEALQDLVQEEEREASARIAAAHVLVGLKESQYAVLVTRAIANDETVDDADRWRAARVLGQAGEMDEAISILLELLHDERTHAVVACHIAQTLAEFGKRQTGIDYLVEAAQDGEPCVICNQTTCSCGRDFIVQKLIKLGEQEIVTSIVEPLLKNETLTVNTRLKAAAILARLGETSEATAVLLGLLHSSEASDYNRGVALEVLGKEGERTEEVLQTLLTTAQNKNAKQNHRWRAVEALGNFGNRSPVVLETLAEFARSDSVSFNRSACESLWKLTEPEFETVAPQP